MGVQIKICGLTNSKDTIEAVVLGAHYIGFIFAESPRKITPQKVAAILYSLQKLNLRSKVTAVGVFVNEKRELIEQYIHESGIDMVQFHGDESPADTNTLSFPWYKALRIASKNDITHCLKPQKQHWGCPHLLIDTKVKGRYGGTGKNIARRIALLAKEKIVAEKKKFFLAGGIKPDTIFSILDGIKPDGIDIGSGIEYKEGIKSHKKMQQLFQEISRYTNEKRKAQ